MLVAMFPTGVLESVLRRGAERLLESSFARDKDDAMPRHIETSTIRTGSRSLVVYGISYHSPKAPNRESPSFFNSLSLKEADIVFQFGSGPGYGFETPRADANHPRASRILSLTMNC